MSRILVAAMVAAVDTMVAAIIVGAIMAADGSYRRFMRRTDS